MDEAAQPFRCKTALHLLGEIAEGRFHLLHRLLHLQHGTADILHGGQGVPAVLLGSCLTIQRCFQSFQLLLAQAEHPGFLVQIRLPPGHLLFLLLQLLQPRLALLQPLLHLFQLAPKLLGVRPPGAMVQIGLQHLQLLLAGIQVLLPQLQFLLPPTLGEGLGVFLLQLSFGFAQLQRRLLQPNLHGGKLPLHPVIQHSKLRGSGDLLQHLQPGIQILLAGIQLIVHTAVQLLQGRFILQIGHLYSSRWGKFPRFISV